LERALALLEPSGCDLDLVDEVGAGVPALPGLGAVGVPVADNLALHGRARLVAAVIPDRSS
jgi:hypothetical protein